jgi:hypothetical protein
MRRARGLKWIGHGLTGPGLMALFTTTAGLGCGGATEAAKPGATSGLELGRRATPLERADCEGDQDLLTDANGDGRANIRHVMRNGRRHCSEIDINFNGRADVIRFYENGDVVLREQHDFDFDGKLDQDTFYAGGRVERKELDTNFDNVVDTWLWCDGGQLSRLERDRRRTGRVDTWELYEQGQLVEVRYDENNDGLPERWELYRGGKLRTVKFDTNGDGHPDLEEPGMSESMVDTSAPIRCDVVVPEQFARTGGGAAAGAEGGSSDGEAP